MQEKPVFLNYCIRIHQTLKKKKETVSLKIKKTYRIVSYLVMAEAV